jgi:hypothetical protein
VPPVAWPALWERDDDEDELEVPTILQAQAEAHVY